MIRLIPNGRARVFKTSMVCGKQASDTKKSFASAFCFCLLLEWKSISIASAAAAASSNNDAFAIGKPVRSETMV